MNKTRRCRGAGGPAAVRAVGRWPRDQAAGSAPSPGGEGPSCGFGWPGLMEASLRGRRGALSQPGAPKVLTQLPPRRPAVGTRGVHAGLQRLPRGNSSLDSGRQGRHLSPKLPSKIVGLPSYVMICGSVWRKSPNSGKKNTFWEIKTVRCLAPPTGAVSEHVPRAHGTRAGGGGECFAHGRAIVSSTLTRDGPALRGAAGPDGTCAPGGRRGHAQVQGDGGCSGSASGSRVVP